MRFSRVSSLRTLAAIPLVGGVSVFAAGDGEKLIKVKDLPLYDAPSKPELIYIDEKISPITPYISAVRKVVWKYAVATKNTTDKVRSGFVASKNFAGDTLELLRADKAVLQRAGIITVAGLGGLIVAGRRGGILRTTAYASTSMVVTAAVVYPKQAVDITQRNWDKVKLEAKSGWNRLTTPAAVPSPPPAKAPVEEIIAPVKSEVENSEPAPMVVLEKDVKVEIGTASEPVSEEKVSKDFGMSKEEDKDMYSTRE